MTKTMSSNAIHGIWALLRWRNARYPSPNNPKKNPIGFIVMANERHAIAIKMSPGLRLFSQVHIDIMAVAMHAYCGKSIADPIMVPICDGIAVKKPKTMAEKLEQFH